MLRHSIAAFLLVAACSGDLYPRFEKVVRDPLVFDLLYSTTAGAHNESWYFDAPVNVTYFIIPTQMTWSSGPEANGTYVEDVELLIYEVYDRSETYLVGNGSYSGTVSMGKTLHIPVMNITTGGELYVRQYLTSLGYNYILSFHFKTTGMYPWYMTRTFSSYSPVSSYTDVEGLAIGLTFSNA
ncbi:uncharacterized protein LOC126458347 [Schistocerca serialis cubense]|uniref:uncharacterized protein LOC126458347 n=1 Tax=Schistocerca serialis cubense TaxID=2023355 RepID=UPI00214E236E|nr:uncharacterized protein LOC126458347 [Schistocerca serialis cubense]